MYIVKFMAGDVMAGVMGHGSLVHEAEHLSRVGHPVPY